MRFGLQIESIRRIGIFIKLNSSRILKIYKYFKLNCVKYFSKIQHNMKNLIGAPIFHDAAKWVIKFKFMNITIIIFGFYGSRQGFCSFIPSSNTISIYSRGTNAQTSSSFNQTWRQVKTNKI